MSTKSQSILVFGSHDEQIVSNECCLPYLNWETQLFLMTAEGFNNNLFVHTLNPTQPRKHFPDLQSVFR